MGIGHGGQLGQMGDAQHLLGAADAGHLLRHLLSGPAGDAGIHLVKDHGAYPVLLRQNVLHGQHDAGQLTAGGDLLDGAQLLAHVGRHKEAHGVHTGLRQGLGLEVDGEADAAHIQLEQLREDLLIQPLGRLMAGLGQLLRRRLGSRQGLLLQLLQMQQGVAGVLDGVQLLGAAVQIGQHTLYIRAILLFQPVQLIQTALHLVQLLRGEVEGVPLVLHGVGQIVNLAVHRLQPLVQLLEAVIQTADGLQSALGLPVLLYLAFRRFAESLLILGSLPFALTGGIWLLYLLGDRLSVAVGTGFIALAGLAAEFGVVMIVYLRHAVQNDKSLADPKTFTVEALDRAIEHGAALRVRPKTMTVAVVLAGLIPILVGTGAGSEVMSRIAAPMVGGMVTAPLLSLFVIPAAWKLIMLRRRKL